MHRVLIEPADYNNVQHAVARAFDLFPIPITGRKVLIKPNVLRASEAGEGIVTHPAVLKAVVAHVAGQAPAEIVVGDNPGVVNYGDNERSFEQTGLMSAAGPYYRNIGTDAVQRDFNPEFMPQVSVSRAVMDADVIISLPKFKTHGLTVITGAVKNSYGFLPGAQKSRLHKAAGSPARFHELVVDVFKIRPPDLFIMDAVVGMEGNGPASPDLRDVGRILASDNAVAMDAVVARMMGVDPSLLGFLIKARAEGLGDFSEASIEIVGELIHITDYKIPPLGGEAIMNNQDIQAFMQQRNMLRPAADGDLCTACGACIDQCPVEALSMDEEQTIPVVAADTCITCFCCQEICPEKAITLR